MCGTPLFYPTYENPPFVQQHCPGCQCGQSWPTTYPEFDLNPPEYKPKHRKPGPAL